VSEERKSPVVPVALATGVVVVAASIGIRWLDRAGVDAPETERSRRRAERAAARAERGALRVEARDTGDLGTRIADQVNPVKVAARSSDRTDRVMADLASSGRPIVRCVLAEPLPGGKARRPQVLDVVGQPPDARLLAFANTDAIYMSLPERSAGSALLAPEGFLPIEIRWEAPPEGESAPCFPEPLRFEKGGSGIAGVVFSGDTPAPDATVVATCGEEVLTTATDAAGEFYLPVAPGPCRVDAVHGEGVNEVASPTLDVEVPDDDDAVIELVLPAGPKPLQRGLRAIQAGIEVTDTDEVMTALGIEPGDVILRIGDEDAHALDAEEADALLDRAATGELSVMWRTPDGDITAQRLQP